MRSCASRKTVLLRLVRNCILTLAAFVGDFKTRDMPVMQGWVSRYGVIVS